MPASSESTRFRGKGPGTTRERSFSKQPKLPQRLVRAAIPFGDEHVAHELQVLHAHLAGPEARCRQIAEASEESEAVRLIGPCRLDAGNVVEHLPPFSVSTCGESLVEAFAAFLIKPGEPSAHRHLPGGLVKHHEIDELRN